MISVIIPLYNCEALIGKCLDSLLAQDVKEPYEIIVVDDGSTDNSLEVARGYEKDTRVKVLTKPNEGPAMARNYGMAHISPQSEWVTFVDSDDYVEPTFLSTLLSVDGDIKICSMWHHEGQRVYPHQVDSNGAFENLSKNESFAALFPTGVMGALCNKLFRTSIIKDNNLIISNIRILEDADFVFRFVQLALTVGIISSPQYHYVHRIGSETSSASAEMLDNYIKLHTEMLGWFDKKLEKLVDEFVYPQYIALILRSLRKGDFKIPRKYMGHKMVRRAFTNHESSSKGEKLLNILLRMRMFGMAKRLI